MAGGKLTARQKMINLMYLIFIAMLALNMSKEVLSAFGLMNERLTESNEAASKRNTDFMQGLVEKFEEQPEKYGPLKAQADEITTLANNYNLYLEKLKGKMTVKLDDAKDYEIMDKADYLDENFFKGDKLKPDGEEFLKQMATFRDGLVNVITNNPDFDGGPISEDVQKKFNTNPIKRGLGTVGWLEHHYKGFPLVASLTKMTQLQADIKTTESEILSSMLQGKLRIEASLTNFDAIVIADKSTFFPGENFTGKIILGKKDITLKADKVIVNGKELLPESMQEGKTVLKFPAGRVGERKIVGEFQFKEDGVPIIIPIEHIYTVVSRPNSATISADKMNVVYRGVDNPMSISFAGISDNNVIARAEGLTKGSGIGKYIMNVTTVKGREITINVTGTLPGGSKVSDAAKFRIKDIPKPTGTVRGEDGLIKMQRNSLEISTVGAKLDEFDFELPLNITGFKFKVLGQPTINVSGNRLNSRAKAALRKARRGSAVQIFEIQAKIKGNSTYKLKKVSPVFVELTN